MTGPWPARRRRRARAVGRVLLLLTSAVSVTATARPNLQAPRPGDAVAAAITESSRRFEVPEIWIRAVIRAESAFDPQATSPVGAMGLMQVMPATYAELRARYGLGFDAYDPRDNVLAGTAYLRELYDRFGLPGALAAYNAGPGRYQEHLQTGRSLPLETRIYVARIAAGGGVGQPLTGMPARPIASPPTPPDPAAAPLFVSTGSPSPSVRAAPGDGRSGLFPARRLSESGDE